MGTNKAKRVDERRLTTSDPMLVALNKMAQTLEPFDRRTQLKILASACAQLELTDHARACLDALDAMPTADPSVIPDEGGSDARRRRR